MTDELALRSHAERGPAEFQFGVTDGPQLVGTDRFRPAELALLEAVTPAPDSDLLAVDGNYGVPGVVLGALSPDGRTVITETSARCAGVCQANATQNGVDADLALVPSVGGVAGAFDLAVHAPRAYDPIDVVTARAGQALAALRPGGELRLAGDGRSGIDRVADRLAAIDGVEVSSRDAGPSDTTVYGLERAANLGTIPSVEDREFGVEAADQATTVVTQPGLFSPDGLDEGTRLLLETVRAARLPADGATVLDLCCGYGVVGATLGQAQPIELLASDDDRRAIACAARTLAANDLGGHLTCCDGMPAVGGDVDLVATNPPTHAGQAVTDALFAGAAEVLAPDGTLAVVYRDAMEYADRLSRWYDEVAVPTASGGYEVALCRPRAPKDTA